MEKTAANELKKYLEMATGVTFSVAHESVAPQSKKIYLGKTNAFSNLGVELDEERNNFGHSDTPVKLSKDSSRVAVYMIPTNEELVIAQDTEALAKA